MNDNLHEDNVEMTAEELKKKEALDRRREKRRENARIERTRAMSPNANYLSGTPYRAKNDDHFTADVIALNMEIASMKKCDLFNPEEVRSRINEYFMVFQKYDLKPTVAGLALALGTNRQRIYDMRTGIDQHGKPVKYPAETVEIVRQVYTILENLMETYALSGKIQPIMAIWNQKNHFGYVDLKEVVLTPNADSQDTFNAEDIKNRYLTDDDIDSSLTT